MKRLFSALLIMVVACATAFANPQKANCKGQVVDAETNETVIGALISLEDGTGLGVTDVDGNFSVQAPASANIRISFMGYKPRVVKANKDMGIIKLDNDEVMLRDVVVTQSLARTRQTPVALSQVNAAEIELRLGNQEFPEILKTTPGVWTTKDGGGFGDAKTNMRGFQSANVAVVINGIPINDMEWGGVYWSNWAGLADVTSNIQTQRGLGAGLLSAPSIGGTINITTRTTDAEKGGSVWYGFGNDGMNNMGFKLSTGLSKNGWAVTVLGSRKWGDGYVQGTFFNSYNYFLNVSKKINDNHMLSLTAFGAPQKHNKRSSQDGLTIEGYQTYAKQVMAGDSPYKYNPTFGYDSHGNIRTSNLNTYHKPQVSLAHQWKISDKSSLSTTIYASIASGGGYSGQGRGEYSYSDWYGASNGVVNTKFRNPDGTFAYDKIEEINANSTTGSSMVMAKSVNAHNWYGLVSTFKDKYFDNKLTFTAGLDLRYYKAFHYSEIVDLYGGEYYVDDSSRKKVLPANSPIYNKNNTAWVYEKLGVGDRVYRDYDSETIQEGLFLQGELNLLDNRLNIVASGSLNNTAYQRIDNFYYDGAKSGWYNFWGGTIKGGANYNIDRNNNVFVNLGYINRAPFMSKGVFLTIATSMATNPNPNHEKITSFEVGYGYHSPKFTVNVNGYYTNWFDKTTSRSVNLSGAAAGQTGSFNMTGVDALHMGVEVSAIYKPFNWVEVEGMISLGNYKWNSNAKGYFYDNLGYPLAALNGTQASAPMAEDHLSATLNQKDIRVGGSAQTTGAVSLRFRPDKHWRIGAEWTFASNNYSDYVISDSHFNPGSDIYVADPWEIPWGSQLDLSASYGFKIGGVDARLSGNVYNIFNYNYVVDAYTNATEEGRWDNAFRVFYSFGRTYAMKLRVNF